MQVGNNLEIRFTVRVDLKNFKFFNHIIVDFLQQTLFVHVVK